MTLKMLREALCKAETDSALPLDVRVGAMALIDVIDEHRPTNSAGEHGDRHTMTCGCDDQEMG